MSEEMNGQKLDVSMFSFADEIMDASSARVGWVKLLTYGSSGAGKTSLIATMPDPLIVLLTEKHGDKVIKRVNPNARIVYIENKIKNGKKISAQEVLFQTLHDLKHKDHPFLSVALDSLTDMQEVLLSDMKGGQPDADVSLKQWGKLINKTKDLIKAFRDLNMHVGVICLADEVQDNNQRLVYRPALAGKKLPGNVIQYFNMCCFQRKARDIESINTKAATYESVFEAGTEYYTKSDPALDPIEVSSVRMWIEKMATYSKSHGEGDMPTESSPVSNEAIIRKEVGVIAERLKGLPAITAAFDALGVEPAAREQAALKYRDDKKLLEVVMKRVAEAAAKGNEKCTTLLGEGGES